MNGLHILANFKDCNFDFSNEISLIQLASNACTSAGLTVLGTLSHSFSPQGLTFVVLLAESHLSMHTWPELRQVALDIYVCNHTQDNSENAKKVFNNIISVLKPEIIDQNFINRESIGQNK